VKGTRRSVGQDRTGGRDRAHRRTRQRRRLQTGPRRPARRPRRRSWIFLRRRMPVGQRRSDGRESTAALRELHAGAIEAIFRRPPTPQHHHQRQEIASLDLHGVEWAVLSPAKPASENCWPGRVFGLRRAFKLPARVPSSPACGPVSDDATETLDVSPLSQTLRPSLDHSAIRNERPAWKP